MTVPFLLVLGPRLHLLLRKSSLLFSLWPTSICLATLLCKQPRSIQADDAVSQTSSLFRTMRGMRIISNVSTF